MSSKPNAFNTGKGTNPRLTKGPELIPSQQWGDVRPRGGEIKKQALEAVKAKIISGNGQGL
jgi:hypothetical protein